MNNEIYLVALHSIWLTHKKLFAIFESFSIHNYQVDTSNSALGSQFSVFHYKEVFENLSFSFLKKYSIEDDKIDSILEQKSKLELAKLNQKIEGLKIKIITYFDSSYPANLKNIFNPPFLLYVRWNISLPWIAFVGSRGITSYWKNVIEKFVPEVWKYFSIISWWAFGCDSYSHEIALKNGVKTISIIWTWIDIDYPTTNKKLYDSIVESGWWIVSIFPFGEPWNPYNFPIRNEIVAWLSVWSVIVEAKEKSGSLITAKLALDLWKEVFAVPWDIFKQNSVWCNNLILKWEAKIVLSSNDILSEFNISDNVKIKKTEVVFSDDIEKNIYDLLLLESLNTDEIANKLSLEINVALLKISILELSNLIKKGDSGKYEVV